MVAYELLSYDDEDGYKVMGLLPERRKPSARIDRKSVMNWGRLYFGNRLNTKDLFFFRITINKKEGGLFQPSAFGKS